jgi:hypothetical protein
MAARGLAQHLIADNVVSAADVQNALQRQVVMGGSLDTNLLESDATAEAPLLQALSTCYGLPAAGRAEIDAVGAHIPRLFPLVFAETYHLVPFKLVEQTLHVLVNEVPEAQLLERIFQRLNLHVAPTITTEARLHYAMHRLYGTELLPRTMALLNKLDGVTQPASLSAPAETGERVLGWGVSSARIAPTRARSGKSLSGQDVRTLVGKLDAARDRDTIVDIVLSFALAVFEFAGLFLVQEEHVHGWRGTDPESTKRIAQISLPLTLPSVFQTLYATQGHYLGPLPANSINGQLLDALGRQPPRAAFLAPVIVGGKLAAILYADNGNSTVAPKKVAALLVLVQRSGLCLERLIRQRKQEAAALVTATPEAPPPLEPPPPAVAGHEADFSGVELPEVPLEAPPVPLPAPVVEAPPSAAPIGVKVAVMPPGDGFAGLEIDIDLDGSLDDDTNDVDVTVESGPTVAPPGGADGYVAFADVHDTPKESLDEWEDVLVDTVAEAAKAALQDKSVTKASAFSVRWEDVIAEAERAAKILPSVTRTIELLGTRVDESDILFDGLGTEDSEARRSAVAGLLKLGAVVDAEIAARFPGSLTFDPLTSSGRLPPFERCSGITELLAARGPDAAPVVLPFLDSDDPVRRFFAIYFLMTVHHPAACEALARRLYDTEPRNRHLAVEALRRYTLEPVYRKIVGGLREQLRVSVPETQVAAIQILGQLREPSAVPALIPLVATSNHDVARTAASALAVVCAQAFGADLGQWQGWWQNNYNKPRAYWLLSGLLHPNATIRRVAHGELQQLTGQVVPFDGEAPEDERQVAVREWQGRLQATGMVTA